MRTDGDRPRVFKVHGDAGDLPSLGANVVVYPDGEADLVIQLSPVRFAQVVHAGDLEDITPEGGSSAPDPRRARERARKLGWRVGGCDV